MRDSEFDARWIGWRLLPTVLVRCGVCMLCLTSLFYGQSTLPARAVGDRDAESLLTAQTLMDAGAFDRAAAVLSELTKTDPGSARGHELLAYSYLRMNQPRSSLEEYTRAAAIERPGAVDLQNVAKDYVLLGDLASADHWATVAVQMNELDAEGWYGLGRIRFSLQRFQEAADCFERSLKLLPRSVKAENNLGLSYEGLNRTEDAIAAYRQAIEWQKDEAHPSEQPLLNLGIVLVHEEKLEEAQGLLLKAEAIAPNDPRIREQLGHLYLQRKMLPEAQAQLEEAVRLEPKNATLHFFLGKVYHQQGEEQKAKGEFELSSKLSGYKSTPEPN
jgi:Flp pilus assembly protein TadD